MEPVVPEYRAPRRTDADWAVTSTGGRGRAVVRSLHLQPHELEEHNRRLQWKYAEIAQREVRFAAEQAEDAEVLIVAYGTAARVARTACERARKSGLRAGIFRPITPGRSHPRHWHAASQLARCWCSSCRRDSWSRTSDWPSRAARPYSCTAEQAA